MATKDELERVGVDELFERVVPYSATYNDLKTKYDELHKKYVRLEKDYKSLQVEHSRVLFDMEAIAQKVVQDKWSNVKKAFKKVLDDLVIDND